MLVYLANTGGARAADSPSGPDVQPRAEVQSGAESRADAERQRREQERRRREEGTGVPRNSDTEEQQSGDAVTPGTQIGRSTALQGGAGVLRSRTSLSPNAGFRAGSYVQPSLFVREVYTDNIFSTATQRQSDWITRATPAISAQYSSRSLTLGGRYSVTGAYYLDHPSLSTPAVAQTEGANISYLPSRLWSLSLYGAHASTHRPTSFVPQTGLQLGRYKATETYAIPSVGYRFSRLTRAAVSGEYLRYRLERLGSIKLHRGSFDMAHDLTRDDEILFNYNYSSYLFSNAPQLRMQALAVGWTRDLTSNTALTLATGPRLTNSDWSPQYYALLQYTGERGGVTLSWLRTKTVVLGETGAVDLRRVTLSGTYSFTRNLALRIVPTMVTDRVSGVTANIYQMNAFLIYRFSDSASIVAAYQYDLQTGALVGQSQQVGTVQPPGGGTLQIRRNIAYLGFVFTIGGQKSASALRGLQSFGGRSGFAAPAGVNPPNSNMGALIK